MRNQLAEAAKPDFANSVLGRLNTPIVRSCLLNLIALVALGTPLAEAQRNFRAAEIYGKKETAQTPSNLLSGNQENSNTLSGCADAKRRSSGSGRKRATRKEK